MSHALEISTLPPDGFWEPEQNRDGQFRWSRPSFALPAPGGNLPYLTLHCASLPVPNRLHLRAGSQERDIELLPGWQRLDLPTFGAARLEFSVSSPFQPVGEQRVLGLMLRSATFHADMRRHELLHLRHANAVLNEREFRSGAEVLASAPPYLRVTVSRDCNIANAVACVYCSWDWAKRMETGAPSQTPEFLERLGRFFDAAQQINDCSYGEPPMERHFARTVTMATEGERVFEFTTNGQTLASRQRAAVIGKPARVYVSIDSATAEGYLRLRDHRFDLVMRNLRALCEERGAAREPEIIVSCIVMRSNLHEVEALTHLVKSAGADRLCFRTLYLEDRLEQRQLAHHGHDFDYDRECLAADELGVVAERCRRAGEETGLEVTVEWDAFVAHHAAPEPGLPLCSEPWKTAYLLARGVLPCCYGRTPLVTWAEIDTDDPEAGVAAALNSEPFRALRRDLAAGRLGTYCHAATGCPIVKTLTVADSSRPLAAE